MAHAIPQSILIRGVRVPLRPRYQREIPDCYGQYHYDLKAIDYRSNIRGALLRDTVLHEILHAILDDQLKHTTEEDYVCSIATGLTRVLQQNPQLRLWLTTF